MFSLHSKNKHQNIFIILTIFFFISKTFSETKENVILIIADDLGIDYVKAYGMREDTPPMPNIDKLIENAILFENAYSFPTCSPTRASILTGRYSFRTNVRCILDTREQDDPNYIRLDELTIPKAIKDMNIKNACLGKWHLASVENGYTYNPNLMGFDHYSGYLNGTLKQGYYVWSKTIDGEIFDGGVYMTTDTRDDAIDWLTKNQNDQFFLWLALIAPHDPFHKPPNELHSYHDLEDIFPEDYDIDVLPWYFAMCESLDTVIGQILDTLDDDVFKRTNIIFLSDNGEHNEIADHGTFEVDKVKGSLYDGAVHVPFFVHGPRVANPGSRSSTMVNSVDIFDTILDMFHCKNKRIPNKISDSISLLPVIEGKVTNTGRKHRFCEQNTGFCTTHTPNKFNLGYTLANDRYKLFMYTNGVEKMFDIENDYYETINLLKTEDFYSNTDLKREYYALKGELIDLLTSEYELNKENYEVV